MEEFENEVICDDCGCVIENDDLYFVNGRTVCVDCWYEYTECDSCGNIENTNDLNIVRMWTGERVDICNICYDALWRCNACGDYISEEDVRIDDYGDGYCPDCYHEDETSDCIEDYGYRPDPIFHNFKDGTKQTKWKEEENTRYYGIEWEIANVYDLSETAMNLTENANGFVYCKEDSSVTDGFEIVSHPATLEYHLSGVWEKIGGIVYNNIPVNCQESAGIHIHINRRAFGDTSEKQTLNIAKLIILFNNSWSDFLVPFSRRNEYRLREWADRVPFDYSPNDTVGKVNDKINEASRYSSRYRAINLRHRETVEIRIFAGTNDYNNLICALELVDELVSVVNIMGFKRIYNSTIKELLSDSISERLLAYLNSLGLL